MSTLNTQLEQIATEFRAQAPVSFLAAVEGSIQQQLAQGSVYGLTVGAKAPDFKLFNAVGATVNLYEQLDQGPVVLTFYRGTWCPYCNRQLRAYQEILPDLQALGAQLIAVSPQLPDSSLSMVEKNELSFQVLSDTRGLVAAKYNLLFDVPQDLREQFVSLGIDLGDYNGPDSWVLPVPATFMIDETAIIRHAYVNPNFLQRMEPDEILSALRAL